MFVVPNCQDRTIETQATTTIDYIDTFAHNIDFYCNANIGLDIGYWLLSVLSISLCAKKRILVHL